ncbi:hypothetical protein JCM19238_2584 [Vibrio ponticus]|nr:hypothetical protein JCM19238_2584 [Vibrio ponticus]
MKIFSAANPPQAHIVCELLRANGITCEVRGEGIFGLQGEVPFGEASELMSGCSILSKRASQNSW